MIYASKAACVSPSRRRGVLVVCCKFSSSCFHLSPPSTLACSDGSINSKSFDCKHEGALHQKPSSKLPCSDGSIKNKSFHGTLEGALHKKPSSSSNPLSKINEDLHKKPSPSSSLLLKISEDVGAFHLHPRALPSVLPSIEHVREGFGNTNCSLKDACKGLPRMGGKDGNMCHPHQGIETVGSPEQNLGNAGTHIRQHNYKDDSTLYRHQNNIESFAAAPLGSLEHSMENMGAAQLPQKNGKNKHTLLISQKDELHPTKAPSSIKQFREDWGTLFRERDIPPDAISSIFKSVPTQKRTQVHFQNIVSLIILFQTMDINRGLIPAIIRKAPFMYQRDPVIHLQPKIEYLETLGLHRAEMQCLVLKYSYALRPPIEDLQAKIQFLRSIPLQHEDVLRMLRKSPLVFRLSIDKYVQPKLELFRSLGMPETDIRRVLVIYPRLFCVPLVKFKKSVSYLQGLGLRPGTKPFSRLLMQTGAMNAEALQLLYIYHLLDAGFSHEEVQVFVPPLPPVLTKGTQDAADRLNYLVNVMKRSPSEVLTYPLFLKGARLDKRIRPRHEALVQWAAEKQAWWGMRVNKGSFSALALFLSSMYCLHASNHSKDAIGVAAAV